MPPMHRLCICARKLHDFKQKENMQFVWSDMSRRASCSGRIEWADGLQPYLQLCTPQYDARCMLVRRYETGRRARAAGALRRRWGSTPQRCHGIGYRRLPRVHVRPSRRAPVGRSAAPRLHIQPPTCSLHARAHSKLDLPPTRVVAWPPASAMLGAGSPACGAPRNTRMPPAAAL